MTRPILYCGDTSLEGAACYLAGILAHMGREFDYVPSHVGLTESSLGEGRALVILSDYPAAQMSSELQQTLATQVRGGTGLLMIGGWESYCGFGGNWQGTPVGSLLPVEMADQDDRVNFDQPALLHPADVSSSLWELPWASRPPTIGGANRFRARADGTTLLQISAFRPRLESSGTVTWGAAVDVLPALVTGQAGAGRTAAFASDVAPHWVGGFVDWGRERVVAQGPGAPAIEVGGDYVAFWERLIGWVSGPGLR